MKWFRKIYWSRRRRHDPLGRFFAVALLLHLQFVLVTVALLSLNPNACNPPANSSFEPVEVSLVGDTAPQELREELEKEQEEERVEDRDEMGQVVDLAPPPEERRPEKSKYLSEYDSTVDKETKGPQRQPKAGRLLTDKPIGPKAQRRSAPPSPSVERKLKTLAMRAQPNLPTSNLPPSPTGDAAPRKQQGGSAPQVQGSPGNNQPKRPTLKDLKLSDAELQSVLGTRANDALEDVKEGESTLLNSRRWRFASFFNRIKRQVAQKWHPDQAYRLRDPSGKVYGFKDRLTVLRVKLTPAGRLKAVQLEKPSGLGFLDEEAVKAFRDAQPFPNPPRGLVNNQTGLISFRFGFLFEIDRRPNLRIFRYR